MKFSVSTIFLSALVLVLAHHVLAFQVVQQNRGVVRENWQSTAPISHSTTIAQSRSTTSSLQMFGGLFGGTGSKNKLALDEPVTVYSAKDDGKHVEFEGLSDYITNWAKMFTNGGIKLTTPVVVESVSSEKARGVRLLFKDTNTGYKSKGEESESGKAARPQQEKSSNETKKKKESKKQGGVEILVEKTGAASSETVQVLVRRCEIDEDTVIKEMSEETIMSELHQAMDVWKREK